MPAGQWQPAGAGRTEVIPRLTAGDDVLVKYEEHDTTMQAGDVTIPGTELRAVEVRRLK